MSYVIRPTRISIAPEGEPILSEQCTHIEINDEGAGEFVVIRQPGGPPDKESVSFNPDEWPLIRDAVESMLRVICK